MVIIGPNFRVLGSVEGTAILHGEACIDMKLADWDYTQQYPDKKGGGDESITGKEDSQQPSIAKGNPSSNVGVPTFHYGTDTKGQLSVV